MLNPCSYPSPLQCVRMQAGTALTPQQDRAVMELLSSEAGTAAERLQELEARLGLDLTGLQLGPGGTATCNLPPEDEDE